MSVVKLQPGESLPEGFHTIPTEEEKDKPTYTVASDVKITRSDGTVEFRPSYTEDEFSAIIGRHARRPIQSKRKTKTKIS